MMAQKDSKMAKLTEEPETEGYWVENCEDRVLVWHKKNQIALLYSSPDIDRKVREVVESRRQKLGEIEERTGWKPD